LIRIFHLPGLLVYGPSGRNAPGGIEHVLGFLLCINARFLRFEVALQLFIVQRAEQKHILSIYTIGFCGRKLILNLLVLQCLLGSGGLLLRLLLFLVVFLDGGRATFTAMRTNSSACGTEPYRQTLHHRQ